MFKFSKIFQLGKQIYGKLKKSWNNIGLCSILKWPGGDLNIRISLVRLLQKQFKMNVTKEIQIFFYKKWKSKSIWCKSFRSNSITENVGLCVRTVVFLRLLLFVSLLSTILTLWKISYALATFLFFIYMKIEDWG